MVDLVAGLGVRRERIRIISPLPNKKGENVQVLREEFNRPGLSVIVARRSCVRYVKEIKEHQRARDAVYAEEGCR